MPDTWGQLIKKISEQSRESTKPTDIIIGSVISAKPLEIQISEKMILDEDFLLLTSNVKDYKVEMSIDIPINGWPGKTQVTIKNGLKKGDVAVLIRQQGGQRYIVLDKVVEE